MKKTSAVVFLLLAVLSSIPTVYAPQEPGTCFPPPCPARGFDLNGVFMLFAVFLMIGYLFSKRVAYAVHKE